MRLERKNKAEISTSSLSTSSFSRRYYYRPTAAGVVVVDNHNIPADADDERQLGLRLQVEVVAVLGLAASIDQGALALAVLAHIRLSLLEDQAALGHSSLETTQARKHAAMVR